MIAKQYKWLESEPGPAMLKEALRHYGKLETPGTKNNPEMIRWAKEVGGDVANVYKADSIPWCGLFMAVCAKRAGWEVPKAPLWALNWGTFGEYACDPMLGDVLVFVRKTSTGATAGHVGLYVGEDANYYHVLGGNQSDAVNIQRIAKSRLYTSRRPKWKIKQPDNVRTIFLAPTGVISTSEV